MAAMLGGHGFVTNGPLLDLHMDSSGPGDQVRLGAPSSVHIHAVMKSIAPIDHLQLVYNGNVVEEIPLEGDRRRAVFNKDLRVQDSGWFTLQAFANSHEPPVDDNFPMATTNPVYRRVANRPVRNKESAEYFIRWIDKLTTMALQQPG